MLFYARYLARFCLFYGVDTLDGRSFFLWILLFLPCLLLLQRVLVLLRLRGLLCRG